MKLRGLAGLAGLCLATTTAYGADLFESAPPPLDAPAGVQQELGSNWYIRGDVGYGVTNQATVETQAGLFPTIGNSPIGDPANPVAVTRGANKSTMSPDISLGVGYRVNDWFRVDATWNFSKGPGFGVSQNVFCPEVANAVSNYNTQIVNGTPSVVTVPYGYAYSYNRCNGQLNGTQYNNTAMVMGYADLGHYWIVTPYVGLGAGLNANTVSGNLNFTQQDTGATYAGPQVTGVAPGIWAVPTGSTQNGYPLYGPLPRPANQSGVPQGIGPVNWARRISTTKYTFAAEAAAGLGFQISQSATLDLAYKVMTYDVTGGVKSFRQAVSLGVRYNIN